MIRRVIEATALAAALVGAAATGTLAQGALPSGAPQQSGPPPLTTPMFITGAKQFDEYATQAGQMAQSKSSNASVKAYGAKMIQEHARAESQLDSAIRQSGMAPVPSVRLNPEQQDALARLQALQGHEFDTEYARQAALAGQYELGLYDEYNLKGNDPAFKQVSKNATPLLKDNVRVAENMVLQLRQMPR